MEKIIGIMGAMRQEVEGIVKMMEDVQAHHIGMRTYYKGKINGISCVLVFSRWGKVAAATTVSGLINVFSITELIFIGVAGGISPRLKIGDIVVADRLIHHDLDARPLMKRYEVPLLNMTYFQSNAELRSISLQAIETVIAKAMVDPFLDAKSEKRFGLNVPQVCIGDIASGDQFFASKSERDMVFRELGNITCVEMEGAAVAQVCYEYRVPFCVIRLISDQADEGSPEDFVDFIDQVASKYSYRIIGEMFSLMSVDISG
jgi:adenosylhomocysteine nucleosidase